MKLNLFFMLDDLTRSIVTEINQKLQHKFGCDVITFAGSDAVIPHVTIAMGDLIKSANLDEFIKFLENVDIGHGFEKFGNPRIERMYLEKQRDRYVFIDFFVSSKLQTTTSSLRDMVFGEWLLDNYNLSDRPHLTVGYRNGEIDSLIGFLRDIELPDTICFSGIALGKTGPKGTVTEILWKKEL